MTQQEPPKIVFPCPGYVVKVVGLVDEQFEHDILTVMKRYDPQLDEAAVTRRPSAKGNYISLSYRILAQSQQQLEQLNSELRRDTRVKTVL